MKLPYKSIFYQLQLSCCCSFVKPPTCSRTENHLWRGTHRSERSSDLLFCSLGCTARACTELQSSPRRPAHLPSPKDTMNWAARRQSGTECSLLPSTSFRCVFVATSEHSGGRGEPLLTDRGLYCPELGLSGIFAFWCVQKKTPLSLWIAQDMALVLLTIAHWTGGARCSISANSAWQTKLRAKAS